MENSAVIESDVDDFNARMLAKIAESQLTRYEGVHFTYEVVLYSPEAKRMFARCFNSFQGNLYIMLAKARYQFPKEVTDQVAEAIEQQIGKCTQQVEQEITAAQTLLGDYGVTRLIDYADAPLTVMAHVISRDGLRYLMLLHKADQMIAMLDTLATVDGMSGNRLEKRKRHFRRKILQIAGTVRAWQEELKRVRTAQDHDRWPSGLRRTADAACLMPVKEAP